MPNWTPDQQNAINARGKNILVSAAAGSGKTAVLVERVVKLITDEINPVDVDKLLVVTFTNAAAAEMKNRISKSLNELNKTNVNDSNIIKQISLLPNASICTIDSFCINLVREYFFKLDISQDFKILDESESVLIEENAVNEVIEALYDDNKEEFRALVELLSSTKNDSNLSQSIKLIYRYIMSQPFPYEWLKNVSACYDPNISIDDSELKQYIVSEIIESCKVAKDIISSSKDLLSFDDEAYDDLIYVLESDFDIFDKIDKSALSSWDELKNAVDNISFVTMTRKKSTAKSIISSNRDLYKNILSKEIAPLVTATADEYRQDCEYLYPILNLLCEIVKDFGDKMLEMKKDMNAYNFSDIMHFAIDLLFNYDDGIITRTELAEDYKNNFAEILVDEYQDTNSAQDTLFKMLSNGFNRFMVGDVKQSIYRFRLAMPKIFNDKRMSYSLYDEDNIDDRQKIILDMNFRSRKGICDYVNFVFSNIMSTKIGELEYNEDNYLNYGSDYKDTDVPCAQIKLVETKEDCDPFEYEAEQVAQMIIKKIESKEIIREGSIYRPINFGDIAILFRSTSNVLNAYRTVFSKYGIPVVSNNKTNLFDNNEVAILISLLRTIDNPTQDIPLLSTLMSVFYGYTVDEISSAKVKYRYNNLYSSIINDDTFSAFIKDIDKYRNYAASMSVESFIRQIISDTSYLSLISAMGNAEQRKQNVNKLIDIAKSFDNGENIGLTAFVRYLDSIIDSKLNVESAELKQTDTNSVQFMTVHKSKGLEFPVVILANADHKYNLQELTNQIQLNDKYGVGLKVHNEELMYRYNSLQYSAIKDMNLTAMMSENLRVLYVALTRAKEQFISVISLDNIEKHIDTLSKKLIDNKINPFIAKRIQNDGDFILLSALIHKDGSMLRNMCEVDILPSATNSSLSVEILDYGMIDDIIQEDVIDYDIDLVNEISEKLQYKYDRAELSGFVSKRTASSLDDSVENYSYFALSKPAYMDDGLSPAQKGTAMHAFMQYCDYTNAKNDLDSEIERLTELGHITELQASSLNRQKLNTFFNSDLANRMLSSNNIYREISLSSFVAASELEDTEFDDKVLVQGIADCVFEEDGELVLVDYKTDKVSSEEELLDRYNKQIMFYKSAVSKALSKSVKEATLYSFSLDKCCIYK